MRISLTCALVLSSCVLLCSAAEKPAFEVASIKPSEPQPMGRVRIMMNADGGMLRYNNVSLKDCIRNAYRVKDFQVQGPDWLDSTRFDIVAKLPDGSSQEQIPEMLQALLAERFKLTVHRDSKEHAIYALVVGKGGPKLKPADPSGAITLPPGAPPLPPPPPGNSGAPPRGAMIMRMDPAGAHLTTPSATLANVADAISRFTERPVIDMTGIEGRYDFDLVFSPETMRGMRVMAGGAMPPAAGGGDHTPGADAPPEPSGSIFDSVQRYGLKLEPRKAPMDVIVVDHIEKTPTEN